MSATYRIINATGARLANSKDGWEFSYGATGASWRKRKSAEGYFRIAIQANGGRPVTLRIEPDNGTPATTEEIKQ